MAFNPLVLPLYHVHWGKKEHLIFAFKKAIGTCYKQNKTTKGYILFQSLRHKKRSESSQKVTLNLLKWVICRVTTF